MKISETYASKYLKAADLQGRTIRVVIASVFSESMDDGKVKPIMFFQNAQKGLVLNRTNASTIAMAFGDDTDNWIGATIELFPQAVAFQGQMQPAIRVKVPADSGPAFAAPQQAPIPQAAPDRIVPNAASHAQYDERNPPPRDDSEPPF